VADWDEGDHPRDEHGRFASAAAEAEGASARAASTGLAEDHKEAARAHKAAASMASQLSDREHHVERQRFHDRKAASLGVEGSARFAHNKRPGRESLKKRLGRVGKQIAARDGHACVYCGRKDTPPSHHLDHLTPRHHGGEDTPTNLVVACRTCNSSRKDLSLADWAAKRPDLKFTAQSIRALARRKLPEVA
jgi:5-methylcytosine-specific restriction endonuclease McrA